MMAETTPRWATAIRSRNLHGIFRSTSRAVWMARSIPLAPVLDASSDEEALAGAEPLRMAIEELAAMAKVRLARRATARGSYRRIQIVSVNIPRPFRPSPTDPLAPYLATMYPSTSVDRRVVILAVQLTPTVKASGVRQVIRNVSDFILEQDVPMSAFEEDAEYVAAALARCGLTTPTDDEWAVVDAWWNSGGEPSVTLLAHPDHLHVFTTPDAARAAAAAGTESDCNRWPESVAHYPLTIGSVAGFDFPAGTDETSSAARWVSRLVDAGAVGVSIKGLVEPAAVTRHELRRRRTEYEHDIQERVAAGKMDRAEQEELVAQLGDTEQEYAIGGPATLTDCSISVAIPGRDENTGYSLTEIGRQCGVTLWTIQHSQPAALAEMFLGSNTRANPYMHDLPVQTISASGITSIARVGDTSGALLGFSERDRQPAYLSPTAASAGDSLPMMLVAGATGSGKSVAMLWVADQFSRIPNVYGERTPVVVIDPKALELNTPIPTPSGWTRIGDISVGDEVFGSDGEVCRVTGMSPVFEHPDLYRVTFDDGQEILADADHQWSVVELTARKERPESRLIRERAASGAVALRALLDSGDVGGEVTLVELLGALRSSGCHLWMRASSLDRALRRGGCLPTTESRPRRWDKGVAVKTLLHVAERELASHRPSERVVTTAEMVAQGVTYGRNRQARFAIRRARPLAMPDADLPVPPYVLGVWLGDGASASKEISVGAEDVDEMSRLLSAEWPIVTVHQRKGRSVSILSLDRDLTRCLYGHDAYATRSSGGGTGTATYCVDCHRVAGAVRRGASDPRVMQNPSLHHRLAEVGVLNNRHIPALYQRASAAQRLALLQGLMDTDGTVKRSGSCRIVLSDERLIGDVLELVRGLGYKATLWVGPSTITEDDPDAPGHKRRRTGGKAYHVNFKTTDPVFRLTRKRELLPKAEPKQSGLHYIRSIEAVESRPARCLVVDSPDHTYLAAQFIPTHNSGSDHSAAVAASGGQVFSLDDLTKADGVFDPIRFARRSETGVELAASVLRVVNPWGDQRDNMETPLTKALHWGVTNGATCTGQALLMAREYSGAPAALVDPVIDLAQSSPMFRSIVGLHQESTALRVAQGITLIKVGEGYFNLPAPGAEPEGQQQRIALSLIRMAVFGSAMAVSGRAGVVMLDEAWIFLGAGRNQVEELGRVARSQQVLPILFTQRVSDALRAELTGYISRGLILPIEDPDEARAACALFRLDPTPARIERITAKKTIGDALTGGAAPNWASMHALRDPQTGRVIRGTIAIYADLVGRQIPIELSIPPAFLSRSSTNPEDIRARQEAERLAAQAQ